jgi:pullulanase/glycogen debranching enzyme
LGTLGSYYACSDYTATNPEFGSVDDFRNLVKQAHDIGFKVLIDWVANHTGGIMFGQRSILIFTGKTWMVISMIQMDGMM